MSHATPTVVSSVQELYEFACSGPLVEKLGLTPKIIAVVKMKSATISIDDFYLTVEDQAELQEENSGNALLEGLVLSIFVNFCLHYLRGNAGSHDLHLSVETLMDLCRLTKEGMKMKLSRYNKSAFGGRGDRSDPSTWPEVEGPLAPILFEGWCLVLNPLKWK
uniref:Uncharacterized protein n=1 Tax=Nelumbo nucifera TaxID=4432 RepID=A0A822YMX0_NELNU|nr:TPA_asm: hypothetical protein HUJ06_012723 [Nelumbo nucifera]